MRRRPMAVANVGGERASTRTIRLAARVAPLLTLLVLLASPALAGMPKEFVYLADVDPTIEQDMRYSTSNNFIGRVVPGYDARECVLVRQAAEALKRVQKSMSAPRASR